MSRSVPSDDRRLLTAREAATFLAISPRLLWALTNSGEIRSVRFGSGRRKNVRYDLTDLDLWIEARKRGGSR